MNDATGKNPVLFRPGYYSDSGKRTKANKNTIRIFDLFYSTGAALKLFHFMKHSLFNREADEFNHMLLELLDALMSNI